MLLKAWMMPSEIIIANFLISFLPEQTVSENKNGALFFLQLKFVFRNKFNVK